MIRSRLFPTIISMKRIISYIVSAVLLWAASSCVDDKLYDDTVIGEGEAVLSAEVLFKNFTPALDNNSRATKGDALDGIENLYIFVYSENGQQLLHSTSFQNGAGLTVTKNNTTTPSDGSYDPKADTPTDKATFDYKLPYGKYKIYAVANVRGEYVQALAPENVSTEADLKKVKFKWNPNEIDKNDQMFGVFTTQQLPQSPAETFNAPVVTINQPGVTLSAWLRRLASKVTVDFDGSELKESVRIYIKKLTIKDIPEYCTLGESNTPGKDDPLIPEGGFINYTNEENPNDPNINWADMEAGIEVIKNSKVGSIDHSHTDKNSLFFYENDQGDKSKDPNKDWYNKIQPADKVGQSINDPEPDPDHESGQNDYKDRVPYGTYIEVEAYYTSENEGKMSKGKIIYRFMLGKDVTFNYDAERNYHYKLTLKFRNWANNPDWHIVYDEPTPSVYTPSIYYISYLYNQQMNFPVRIVTPDGTSASNYTLYAEIVANNWAPTSYDPGDDDTNFGDVPPAQEGAYGSLNGYAWNKSAFDGALAAPGSAYGSKTYNYQGRNIRVGANYVGFLTLRKNTHTIIGAGIGYQATDANGTYTTPGFLEDFYNGDGEASPRWWATYDLANTGHNNVCGNSVDGSYKITHHDDGSITASVPMFTRAKEIVPATDFSGNNFNVAYMRYALVKFQLFKTDDTKRENPIPFVDIDDPDNFTKPDGERTMVTERIVPIFQVRRIVNPKAIWRKSGSKEEFHVQLMQRESESTTTFSTFKSRGTWRAYVIADPDGIVTLKSGSQTVTGVNTLDEYDQPTGTNMITGSDGTEVDFYYHPSGTDGCAIIRVDYHDNSCQHLIFVRTGYNYGVTLGSAKWSSYNAYATSADDTWANTSNFFNPEQPTEVRVELTRHPFSVGTFYKRNNYYCGILEENNKQYGWLDNVGGLKYINLGNDLNSPTRVTSNTHTGNTVNWNQFAGYGWSSQGASDKWNRANVEWAGTWTPWNSNIPATEQLAVPTYDDFYSLIDTKNHPEIEFGYGVAYTDGATKVAVSMDDAYGFTDYDNDGNADETGLNNETKGMRVCVVYNRENGAQTLFPMGSIGQSRRAIQVSNGGNLFNVSTGGSGSLSYGKLKGPLNSAVNGLRPNTYNLYRMTGAVYWMSTTSLRVQPNGNKDDSDDRTASWDINYNNLVFNHYDYSSLNHETKDGRQWTATYSSDALPIKLIYKKTTTN